MTAAGPVDWLAANQAYLGAAVAATRRRLERYVALTSGTAQAAAPDADGTAELEVLEKRLPAPSALHGLCATFGLSGFERDVLVLCAGVELDARVAALCAAAQGDRRCAHATFGLALAALADPHWSALGPAAPLRRWRLVTLAAGEGLTTSALRIDERVLHYLAGVAYLDDRLDGVLEAVEAPAALSASQRAVADRLLAAWGGDDRRGPRPPVQLSGADAASKAAIAASACAALGMGVLRLRAGDLPSQAAERVELVRLIGRELALCRSALMILEDPEVSGAAAERAVVDVLRGIAAPVILAIREPLALDGQATIRLGVSRAPAAEQEELWRQVLGPLAPRLNGQIERVVAQFGLDAGRIRTAGALLRQDRVEGAALAGRLWDACRAQARRSLDDLAQRIEAMATWDDLVLPEPQLQALREIPVHVRQRRTVYETWGFAAKSSRGLGIGALFAGASGTGKTMAAEVLANELRLDLYRIDLSQVVSKYIGETEKNLRRVFDAAEQSGAILLFDEADALFGKRSEVKDSHDRYANIEVSYLLQRMEAYRGLAILTTNMKSALDPAFLRRIRFVIVFPFPDLALRAEIWRRVFPGATPTERLEPARLGRLALAGGNIRNIALNAAFLAAEQSAPVGMAHLLQAARGEYAKLEKPLSSSELGDWV